MSNKKEHQFDEIIGDGTGLINPNREDFRHLRTEIQKHASGRSREENIRINIKGIIYRMESYFEDRLAEPLVPVGSFLKELVEAIQIPHKDFAAYIGMKNTNLSAIYRGRRRINHDMAMKLGHIFHMSPALWLHLQNKVELLEIQAQGEQSYQQYRLSDLLKRVG